MCETKKIDHTIKTIDNSSRPCPDFWESTIQ